ncbi:PP2C family serine/threonine-protein phosphatase [Microbacterium sp. MPKO10]|uniref:PP2C family protein-serine/threonine phosphatase n=1 Tax=Microbacterium sp. MPKO10 TaxID=2989818 RepID=UPI002235F2F5|nr:protein phosphatase 2C domain-containing protein [Microbacterium sp. MPKO10]MCW4457527.1 protein phosphatase 2C domain-containing protein [Microbacterium sp. MPKO10]
MATRTTYSLPRSRVEITVTGVTDVGRRRRVNEDSIIMASPIFAVADGMGGHQRGDEASRVVVEQLQLSVRPGEPSSPEVVFTGITAANARILSWADEGGVAGSTVAGVALVSLSPQADSHWMVFNIGDSRVYILNGSHLRQITVDHSAVQELIDDGSITPEAAATHPQRNVVTRAVGVETDADPDVWLLPAEGHQTFIVCSDGLSREVTDDEIRSILLEGPADPAQALVDRALASGARDNVSALVVDTVSIDTTPPSPGYHDTRGLGALEETLPRSR